MRWQYKIALFLMILSQVVFFVFVAYNTESKVNYPQVGAEERRTIGYSWIWYHPEQWLISLLLSFGSLLVCIYGLLVDLKKSGLSLSHLVKIEVVDSKEEKN